MRVAPSYKVTVVAAVVVPVMTGVVTLVFLSEAERPESLAAARTGVAGADGAAVSMVMLVLDETGPTLPATSVALTFIGFTPAPNKLDVTV